jgi:starch synthase
MPSRFEPCGLNQMISMRYGTIPIVTCVGGLRDTVTALGEGDSPTGVRVKNPTAADLLDAVRQAYSLYQGPKGRLVATRGNAMRKDVSWRHSAIQYYNLYAKMINFRERRR